jgi:META domain
MKQLLLSLAIAGGLLFEACSTARSGARSGSTTHTTLNAPPGKVYSTDSVLIDPKYTSIVLGSWRVDSIVLGKTLSDVSPAHLELTLSEIEQYVCKADCGQVKGKFHIVKNNITFDQGLVSAGGCNQGPLADLAGKLHLQVIRYQSDGHRLLLQDGAGTTLVAATNINQTSIR